MFKEKKRDYIWNTVGSLIYALNSVILLMIVVRVAGPDQGGIFSIAYTISQMLMIVGCFEMKVFQITDNGAYSFQEYFKSRIYTSGLMIAIAVVWVLIDNSDKEKSIVTILLCLYRLSDSFGDVIEGYFQQTNRLYISGKLLSVRTGMPTLIFIALLFITGNLMFSCFVLMLSAILFVIIFDFVFLLLKDKIRIIGASSRRVVELLLLCLPLFASSFLATYITSAPKYAIDRYLSKDMQTYYGIIFMPSFAINLISGFVFKPILTDVAAIWNDGKTGRILSIIAKMSLCIIIITSVCVIAGWVAGTHVLSAVYDLKNMDMYKNQLVIMLIGGGINSYNIFLYYILTVMRKQKYILAGYIFVFCEAIILSDILVKKTYIFGAAMAYLICSLSLELIFICKIFFNIHKFKEITKV